PDGHHRKSSRQYMFARRSFERFLAGDRARQGKRFVKVMERGGNPASINQHPGKCVVWIGNLDEAGALVMAYRTSRRSLRPWWRSHASQRELFLGPSVWRFLSRALGSCSPVRMVSRATIGAARDS